MSLDEITTKRRKFRKRLNKITFETEIVTKDAAKHAVVEQEVLEPLIKPTKIHKSKKSKVQETIVKSVSPKSHKTAKKQKSGSPPDINEVETKETSDEQNDEAHTTKPEPQKGDSKRAKKRKKYEQLLLEKKVKVDVGTRDKCLNYLSNWKHNHSDWKFEKLKQVWLQQNMFETEKVPSTFWDTLMEYFNNSKGKIRQKIIEEALKLVDQDTPNDSSIDVEEEDTNIESNIKLKRAKDVIQYLQT